MSRLCVSVCEESGGRREVYFYSLYLCSHQGKRESGGGVMTSKQMKDRQKERINQNSCPGMMNHGLIKGAIMLLLHFFWPHPSPSSSCASECNFKFALTGLTVGVKKTDDAHRLHHACFSSY